MEIRSDHKLKEVFTQECSNLSLSSNVKDRIDEEIRKNQEGMKGMKHLSVKKAVILAAAACLLVSGGAYAAGHATSLVSHSYANGKYHNYSEDMAKAEEELGYGVLTVESFENGYSFKEMQVTEVQGMDEEGNEVYTYPEMMIGYEKEGQPRFYIDMHRPVETEERNKTPEATRVCGDITLYYDEYTYKFVPTDYELTPEDLENEQKDNYFISVGSDEVEIQKSIGVTWEMDGVKYNMAGFDLEMSADEMFDMAESIIQNGI